jgi:hypothetical protein
MGRALEQLHADLALKFANAAAQSWLRKPHLLRRLSQTAAFSRRYESSELMEFHAPSSNNKNASRIACLL